MHPIFPRRLLQCLSQLLGPEPTSRDGRYLVAIEGKADKRLTLSKDQLSLAPSFRQAEFLKLDQLWAETRTCRNAPYANV